MMNLTIRDVIELVASGVPNPEVRLEKAYEWSHTRRLELVKWILAAAVGLFVPLVVAFFREELGEGIPGSWTIGTVMDSAGLAVLGIVMLIMSVRLYRSHLAAQALLGEVRRIAPFLDRYRHELKRR